MLKNFNLNKLKKIDKSQIKEKIKELKSQYDKDAIIYTCLLIAVLAYGLPKFIFPNITEIPENFNELIVKQETTRDMEKRLALLEKPKEEPEKPTEHPVKIYEAPYKEIELENAATGLINQVITIIKENGDNKVESFEFEEKELVDKSGLKSENHSVLSVKVQLETTYENVQNILNEIYLMKHLVKIQNISVNNIPESNFQRVSAYLVLDLYVKTS